MLEREERSQRFRWGMSILDAYLYYNEKENFHDINIVSETFFSDLLNVLFGFELVNANKIRKNTAGYDLLDMKNKLLVQVSSSARPEKIKHTMEQIGSISGKKEAARKEIEKLEGASILSRADSEKLEDLQKEYDAYIDFTGFTVKFMFLKRRDKMESVEKYQGRSGQGYWVPRGVYFDREKDVICMDDLCREVEYLSEVYDVGKIDCLDEFMRRNGNLFFWRIDPPCAADGVRGIIQEYRDNFESPLFLHTYSANAENVTLKNLYIEPTYLLGEGNPVIEQSNHDQTAGKDGKGQTSVRNSIGSVELISDFIWGKDEDRFLFIDGDAAVGKTSLVSWLCYHYMEQDMEGRAIFCDRKMVCVRLRELTQEQLSGSIEKCILDYLHVSDRKRFDETYKDAVFVLDGADELNMVANVSAQTIEQFLLGMRKAFRRHRIICTSRPKFIDVKKISQSEIGFRVVTIEHFDEPMRKRWIRKYENTGEVIADETKKFICDLSDEVVGGVADTPLALYLLVACKIREDIKNNQWALYHEIFHNAIIRTRYNENLRDESGHPILDNQFGEEVYRVVGEIAFAMFQNSGEDRYYITSAELDRIIDRHGFPYDSRKLVKRACVLCAYWKKNSREGALEFYHNDIRDYFFSEYIYRELLTINDIEGQDYIEKFLELSFRLLQYGYVAETTWEQTFRFLYLRLKYFYKKDRLEGQIDAGKVKENYARLISAAVHGSIAASDGKTMFTYAAYKRAFINMTLLLKIIMIGAEIDDQPTFWIDKKEKEEWEQSDLISDWYELATMGIMRIETAEKYPRQGLYSDIISTSVTFYSFTDLSGFNFNKVPLVDGVLHSDVLRDVSFVRKDLSGAYFKNSLLSGADLSDAILNMARFSHSLIRECNFSRAETHDCLMQMVEIQGGSFPADRFFSIKQSRIKEVVFASEVSFCDMVVCAFEHCTIPKGNFKKLQLENCIFEICDMRSSMFHDIIAIDIQFKNCHLEKSVMNRSRFEDSVFKDCHFDAADMLNGVFVRTKFENCAFRDVYLRDAQFIDCTLDEASMESLKDSKAGNYDEMKYTILTDKERKVYKVREHRFN